MWWKIRMGTIGNTHAMVTILDRKIFFKNQVHPQIWHHCEYPTAVWIDLYSTSQFACTLDVRKRRTVSSAIFRPQHVCASHKRPRLLSSMPTIWMRTPLGWWVMPYMSYMEMMLLTSWIWLGTQIYANIGLCKAVHKCTWILALGIWMWGI